MLSNGKQSVRLTAKGPEKQISQNFCKQVWTVPVISHTYPLLTVRVEPIAPATAFGYSRKVLTAEQKFVPASQSRCGSLLNKISLLQFHRLYQRRRRKKFADV